MSNEITAVYGGAFDCPTMGHYHIVEKANKLFGEVVVVLAKNPNKKTMFTVNERVEMLTDMFKDLPKVRVDTLSEHEYLVKYAEKIDATFLIRGIRDTIDFPYEQNIYRTNRTISNSVETIYLMPDDKFSLVSSSWVKGLIGMNGWCDVIKSQVTPLTLFKLQERYVLDFTKMIYEELVTTNILRTDKYAEICTHIVKGYSTNAYHGYSHIIAGIEGLREYGKNVTPMMYYAWLMHDVLPTEDASSELAQRFMCYADNDDLHNRNYVKQLITATKHTTEQYDLEDEQLFASVDLLILSSSPEKYAEYMDNVYAEYYKKSGVTCKVKFNGLWKTGRTKFLKGMLARKSIYTHKELKLKTVNYGTRNTFVYLEEVARNNMKKEILLLKR